MGWIAVELRPRGRKGQSASVLHLTVHETQGDAEAAAADRRTEDAMFNDRPPRIVVVEVPE